MNTLTMPFTRHLWGALIALTACAGFLISAPAAHATPASGWIWGGTESTTTPPSYIGTGWFSMNASNPNDTTPDGRYVVDIPFVDGDITGYAWGGGTTASAGTEHFYGWLSFEETLHSVAACGGKGNARRVGNKIVGAAIIVASAGSGEYDGCVVFNHGQTASEVTIDPATGTISGYAWSSDLGWLDMSKVTIAASGAKAGTLTGVNCDIPEGGTTCSPSLNWMVNSWVTGAELRDTAGPTHALAIPPTSGTFTVTPLGDGVSKTFGLYGTSVAEPAMGILQPGVTVTAQCKAPRLMIGGVCKTPAATGNIVVKDATTGAVIAAAPYDCTIPLNGSSCSRRVEWSISGASTPSFKIDGIVISNLASGTVSPNPTFDGSGVSKAFAMFDGSTPIGSTVQIKGVCESGSHWETGSCKQDVAPSGSITTGTCTVATGAHSCTATVDWLTNSSVAHPAIYENKNGAGQVLKGWTSAGSFSVTLQMKADGTGQSAVYDLYDGDNVTGSPLDGPKTITAQCASGFAYSSALGCQATTLTPSLSGLDTCTIAIGSSACSSVPLAWSLSGSFGTATVRAIGGGYDVAGRKYGTEPAPTVVISAADFVNVVGNGTVQFRVVAWVNNVETPVGITHSVTGSCVAGSHWDPSSGKCVADASVPTGDLTVAPQTGGAGGCENLVSGYTDCPVYVSWTSTGASTPLKIKRTVVTTGEEVTPLTNLPDSDTNRDDYLPKPGEYRYGLYDNTNTLLGSEVTIKMSCAPDLTWIDGSGCTPEGWGRIQFKIGATFTTEPCKVQEGNDSCEMEKGEITVHNVEKPQVWLANSDGNSKIAEFPGVPASDTNASREVGGPIILNLGNNAFSIIDSNTNNPIMLDTDYSGGIDGSDSPTKVFTVECESGLRPDASGKCNRSGPQ